MHQTYNAIRDGLKLEDQILGHFKTEFNRFGEQVAGPFIPIDEESKDPKPINRKLKDEQLIKYIKTLMEEKFPKNANDYVYYFMNLIINSEEPEQMRNKPNANE